MVANFGSFLISPGFLLNFRKSHQSSNSQLKSSASHGEKKIEGVPKDPPGPNRVKGVTINMGTKNKRYYLLVFLSLCRNS